MDIFDKIQGRFKDKPDYDGLNEELLWASIEQNLDAANAEDKKRRGLLLYLLPLGLLMFTGIATYTFWPNNSAPQASITTSTDIENKPSQSFTTEKINCLEENETLTTNFTATKQLKEEEKKETIENVNLADNSTSDEASSITKPIIENEIESSLVAQNTKAKKEDKNENNLIKFQKDQYEQTPVKSQTQNIKIADTKPVNTEKSSTQTTKSDLKPIAELNQLKNDNTKLATPPSHEKSSVSQKLKGDFSAQTQLPTTKTSVKQKERKPLITRKPVKSFSSLKSVGFSSIPNQKKATKPKQRQHEFPKFVSKLKNLRIGLLAGVNVSKPYFLKTIEDDSEFNNQLKRTHKAGLGKTFALHFSWQAKSIPLVIASGLNYNDFEHRFIIALRNDSTYVNANNITVDGIAIRKVQHHNHYTVLSLPIEVGSFITKNKLIIGLNAGLGLNLLTKLKGKSLNNVDSISEIQFKDEGGTNFRQFFISAHLSPNLSYRLSDKFLLHARSSIQYLHNGQSKFHQLKHYNLVYDFKLGFLFEF